MVYNYNYSSAIPHSTLPFPPKSGERDPRDGISVAFGIGDNGSLGER